MGLSRVASMAYANGSSSETTYWVVLAVEFRFWWGIMYEPSGAGWRVGVAREKLSSMRWIEVRNALDAFSPREMA